MTTRRVAFGLLLASLLSPVARAADLPQQVFAAAPEDEVQDIVFFGDGRPVFLRLRVQVESQGFRIAWADFVGRLHRYLDGDHDGTLTLQEAQRGSWSQLLRSPFGGGPAVEQRVFSRLGTLTIDSTPKDGKVSLDELSNYLRESLTFGEFGVQNGPPPDNRTQATFGVLDRDGDGRLSEADLTATDELVSRLDRDGDEKVHPDELRTDQPDSYSRQLFGQPNPTAMNAATAPFVALTSPQVRSATMRRLLTTYDGAGGKDPARRDRKLDAGELGLTADAIRPVDADGDGALDSLELEGLLAGPPPSADLTITLGGTSGNRVQVSPRSAGATALKPNLDGALVAEFGEVMLEFSVGDATQNFQDFFNQQFTSADSDNNGYLEAKEVRQNGFLNQFFAAADRDGDGKLFKPELDAYTERQGDAQKSQTMLTVSDRGRALFEILEWDPLESTCRHASLSIL